MKEQRESGSSLPAGLFSESDQLLLMSRLWELLARQTEKYTMGESSSVPAETAQELLSSLWYTLTVALDNEGVPYSALLTGELRPRLARGQQLLQARLVKLRTLWATACRTAPEIENAYYTDTLRGLGEYLSRYDWRFFAHRVPADIDYPLLVSPSEELSGLSYAEEYLKRILAENMLLRLFEQREVILILQTLTPEYKDCYLNLCEQPLANALGLALAGKPGRSPAVSDEDRRRLLTALGDKDIDGLRQALAQAADALCGELSLSSAFVRDYLSRFAADLAPRLEAALAAKDLTGIFL